MKLSLVPLNQGVHGGGIFHVQQRHIGTRTGYQPPHGSGMYTVKVKQDPDAPKALQVALHFAISAIVHPPPGTATGGTRGMICNPKGSTLFNALL